MSDMYDDAEFTNYNYNNTTRVNKKMSSVIEGQVEFVKQNNAGYYAVKMSDGQWYGCTKDKPEFDKGDNIRFEVVTNGRFLNVDMASVETLAASAAPARKAPPVARSGSAQKFTKDVSKDDYWKAKETRDIARDERLTKRDIMTQNEIRFQASRNAAIELMGIALSNKLIEFGEPKKKGQNLEVLATYVDKLTAKYYEATKAINPAPVAKAPEEESPSKESPEDDFGDDISF